MSDYFIGEIRIVGFNFAPRGWAMCDGQVMPATQNLALYGLLGTAFGGDGLSTFALPNLQGRVPMGTGPGPALTPRTLGESGGATDVTLSLSQLPSHTHALVASSSPASSRSPSGTALARSRNGSAYQTTVNQNLANMAPGAVSPAGGGQPHNNMQPYLAMYFVIALQGVYPPEP